MRERAIERLKRHDIKPSEQRIVIMQYLLTHHNHPTADIIYSELAPSMPTLSKTTIYNTLKLLANHGAVTEMTIDKRNAHYDYDTVPHSHFMCRQCGKIIDMPPDDTAAEPGASYHNSRSEQNGIQFVIEETEINYRGLCGDCLQKE